MPLHLLDNLSNLSVTSGVILKSPDNTRFRVTVTNSGALSTTQL